MTLGQNQEVFAQQAAMLILKAIEMGYGVRLGEVMRPIEMQQLYVQTGRSKTMNSQHIKKLAIDLNLIKDGKLCTREQIAPLGNWWEALDPKNRWGGNWKSFVDAPHFERQE